MTKASNILTAASIVTGMLGLWVNTTYQTNRVREEASKAVNKALREATAGSQELQPRRDPAAAVGAGRREPESVAPMGTGVWNAGQQGQLKAQEKATFTVQLGEGSDYAIHGTCDQDCDLVVRDPEGSEVGRDHMLDVVPVVQLMAEQTGCFEVEVSCPTDDCMWEVRTEETRSGSLAADGEATIPIRLEAGTEYRLSGLCDDDCTDLDLRLRNPEGEQVDEDTLLDAFPLLLFQPQPEAAEEYALVVEMIACSIEPCVWTVLASPTR